MSAGTSLASCLRLRIQNLSGMGDLRKIGIGRRPGLQEGLVANTGTLRITRKFLDPRESIQSEAGVGPLHQSSIVGALCSGIILDLKQDCSLGFADGADIKRRLMIAEFFFIPRRRGV